MIYQATESDLKDLIGRLNLLHTWTTDRLRTENPQIAHMIKGPLHEGQLPLIHAIFVNGVLEAKLQCGRGFGKTEEALYIAVRWAITFPKQVIYILTPKRNQGKEIYWSSRRLQDYCPPSLVVDERDSELRLVLFNGSSICVNGTDNAAALRGVKPHLCVYDEDQDHDEEVDKHMRPNLGSKRAPLIRIGTPPEMEGYCSRVAADIQKKYEAGSKRHFYLERPTWTNPYFDMEFLEEVKERLIEQGDEDEFWREYGAKFIPGGKRAVFPMWHRRKPYILSSKQQLLTAIRREGVKGYNWYTVIDPGQACFAVLFIAIHKYRSEFIVLEEIYERNRNYTSTGHIWPRIRNIQSELCDADGVWQNVCDEAASQFRIEVWDRSQGQDVIYPTKKKARNKKDDISTIKDMMLKDGCFKMADECKYTQHEIQNYMHKEDGTYPDKGDHNIDNLRYAIAHNNFSLYDTIVVNEDKDEEDRRSHPATLGELLKKASLANDYLAGGQEPFYDEVAREYSW